MPKYARTILFIPLVALLLVVLPSLLISLIAETPPVLGSTVPPATRTPRPYPTRTPVPASTLTPSPTPTASPTRSRFAYSDPRVAANGYVLEKVVGNRLSPTFYGLTQNRRLYRSPNDGRTWQLVTSRPEVENFIFGPQDPGVLYAGLLQCPEAPTEPHILRSKDGGAGWTRINVENALLPLLVDPGDSQSVLASGCDGLFASSDGGVTWQPRSATGEDGIPTGYVVRQLVAVYYANTSDTMVQTLDVLYGAAFDEMGAAVVLLSEDAGATWSVITPLLDGVNFHITALTADILTQGRAWFSAERGVWGTSDDGQAWSFSNRGLDAEAILNALVYHPSERLYLGTGRGLYARPGEGLRWSLVGDPFLPSQVIEGILFTDSRPDILWLNTANGVFTHAVP